MKILSTKEYEGLLDKLKYFEEKSRWLREKSEEYKNKMNENIFKNIPDYPDYYQCSWCGTRGFNKDNYKEFKKKVSLGSDKYIIQDICKECLKK